MLSDGYYLILPQKDGDPVAQAFNLVQSGKGSDFLSVRITKGVIRFHQKIPLWVHHLVGLQNEQ